MWRYLLYRKILHDNFQLQGEKKNFKEIQEEIVSETDRIAKGRNVSSVPIYLKVTSPHVVNLTLVDLPGLTKVPVDGQPETIVRDIEDMVSMLWIHCLLVAQTCVNTYSISI